MKIIYYDSTGRYLAAVAAAIHLNMLTANKEVPAWDELKKLPYFDTQQRVKLGQIIFVGTDRLENEIYILGSERVGDVIEKTVQGINRIFGINDEFLFVDLTKLEGSLLKFGLITKRLFPDLGNKLIHAQLVNSFSGIVKEAEKLKDNRKGKGEN